MSARHPVLPWLVWSVAVLAYAAAIINRSSLSALGPAAQEHFGIDATALGAFAMLQLAVYAGVQIPVGMLLDRFGPTILILSGSLLMVIGQLVMATVSEVWIAILARMLVGAGDACTFTSMIRMLPEWFSLKQLPTVSQLSGQIGQVGQLVSVTPLALLVDEAGWTVGFLGVVGLSVFIIILGSLVLRDRPGTGTLVERISGRLGNTSRNARSYAANDTTGTILATAPPATGLIQTVAQEERRRRRVLSGGFWDLVRRLLSIPGVRLAFWVHFTAPFAMTSFVLLWGTPFLTGGLRFDDATSRWLLSLTVIVSMGAGILLGGLTSRYLENRVWFYIGITIAIIAVWLIVLLWPGTPPEWLIYTLAIVMPLGGPASMIAFEVVRSHTPRSMLGTGTGLVNMGGFISALSVILLIGLVLDLQGAGSPENYTLDAFRVAFAVQVPFWALGLTMVLVERRRTLAWMRTHGRKLR